MMMTRLINEMLKCRCVVDRSIVVEIGMKGEVGERFPRRLIGRHFESMKVERWIVTDRRAGDHRNPLDSSVAHFPALLRMKNRQPRADEWARLQITFSCCICSFIWIVFFLSLHRLFWNQTLITLGDKPVISTSCSFISASGRGFAL